MAMPHSAERGHDLVLGQKLEQAHWRSAEAHLVA